MNKYIYVAVEGLIDQEIATRLAVDSGFELAGEPLGRKGKNYINEKLPNFNKSARNLYWLVVRDLDHDADCAPQLKIKLLPKPEDKICFPLPYEKLNHGLWRTLSVFPNSCI